MSLTPEERHRIYEEEKAHIEAQEQIRAEMAAEKARAEAHEKAEQQKYNRLGNLVVFGALVAVVLAIFIWNQFFNASRSDDQWTRYVYAPFAGIDEGSLKAMIQADYAKDTQSQQKLWAAGRLLRVQDGTKVRMAKISEGKYADVQIVEGPHEGESAWVSTAWLRSEVPTAASPPVVPEANQTPTSGPSVTKACDDFTAEFKTLDPMLRNIVSQISCGGTPGRIYRLTLTVRDSVPDGLGWLSLSHTERLKFTQTMWKAWVHFADTEHPDNDYIIIESEAGENLGGSGFAGSIITVKGGQE